MKCLACSEPAATDGFCERCYCDLRFGLGESLLVAKKLTAAINELRCELNIYELIVSEYNATIAAQHDTIQRQQNHIHELEALLSSAIVAQQRITELETNNWHWAVLFLQKSNAHADRVSALKQRITELEFDNATYKEIITDWQMGLNAVVEKIDGALYSEGCAL